MNSVGFALPRPSDRDVLLAFVAGLVVAVCWRNSVATSYSDFLAAFLRDRSGVGAAELLTIAVMALLVVRFRREDLLSGSDLVVIAIASLAFALPFRLAASIPLTAVGSKLIFHRDLRVRSVGQVLVALAFYEWFGPTLFHILSPIALRGEAFAIQAVLAPMGFARNGLMIASSADNGVIIDEGCSAFHNLSLSTLIWISLIKLETLTIKSIHVWIALAMAGATIALNIVRIALMAQSAAMFQFWHNGAGVPIVSFTMLAVILAICLSGLRFAVEQ